MKEIEDDTRGGKDIWCSCDSASVSCSVMSNPLQPRGL